MTCIKESSRSRNGRKSRQGSARKKHRQQQKRRLRGDSLCTASGNLARTATLQAKLIMTFGKLLCQGELVPKNIARGLPLLEELAENGVTFGSYIAGKVYLKEEGWQDIKKAILYFRQAAEDGNSFAEYQLGRIYYFGNGVRVDQEKGLEYLKESAAHGNEYAANLLLTIQQQHTWGVASCTASLIAQLGRIFQEQDQKQSQRQRPRMDRKHRREIEEKKQAMGIRD